MNTTILALDLASVTGWAVGEPGKLLAHGFIRFAGAGASHEAVFSGALRWTSEKIMFYKPSQIVWESPLPTNFRRGKTNINTTALLHGLPAVIGAVAHLHSVFDCRKASTKDVRLHFISQNPAGHIGKKLVVRQCRAMGWPVTDDNEADAIATWSYASSLMDPKLAIKPLPLFGARG